MLATIEQFVASLEQFVASLDVKWVIVAVTGVNIASFLVILSFIWILWNHPETFLDYVTKERMIAYIEKTAEEEEKEKVDQSTDSDDRSDTAKKGDKKKKKVSKK